jgi:ferredoxin-NADP reductase
MGAMNRTLRVHRMTWEAEGVLSLELRDPQGAALPSWEPGAHIDLLLTGAPVRQYSLCGNPVEVATWRIAVLREPDSRGGSQAVHERVRPGDLVEVGGPRNNFAFVPSPRYQFIAGGIGITPILPMVMAAQQAGAEWSLSYGGRTRGSMAFVEQLLDCGPNVTLQPQDECGLMDLSPLATPASDTLIYCCGPEPLLAAVESACAGWPEGALQVERFRPVEPCGLITGDAPFTLVLQRSGLELEVPAGSSVLEAMEAAGLSAENSCREGICGTCETKVVAGVPDHRDSLLSEAERAENATMMICVGRALTDRLALDL